MSNKLHHGDCLEVMPTLDADSVDAIISDPPYGLSFMGKAWDHGVPGEVFWREALRVAKPGAHLLAFGGTRTFHRLTVAIEDAGWEIRDCVMWVYGSGFPKSHDVSKAIDKAAGAKREPGNAGRYSARRPANYVVTNIGEFTETLGSSASALVTAPATESAKQWEGWGTALKPAWEPIIVARKPLIGTVAANVLAHGTGGINVDACRVVWKNEKDSAAAAAAAIGFCNSRANGTAKQSVSIGKERRNGTNTYDPTSIAGRWPANLIHDGSDEVTAGFPNAGGGFGVRGKGGQTYANGKGFANTLAVTGQEVGYGDTGSAARFFYCAKASKADRNEGCEGMPTHDIYSEAKPCADRDNIKQGQMHNNHPTVKPTALMRYLCKLVTPHNGIILDPFMGSGSTGKAATLERFNFIGIDLSAEYVAIAQARIDAATKQIAEQLQYGSS
jgi:site-specific DNA-methyltransferase (adenine-specific)